MTMEEYKKEFAEGRISRDNIADMATKAKITKDAETSREILSLNEPNRRMTSEMDSSGPLLTNYLGNAAMGASKADMDLAFRTFLSVFRIGFMPVHQYRRKWMESRGLEEVLPFAP